MSGLNITDLDAYEVLDCRGNPTLRVVIELEDELQVAADVPSGKSTGANEAFELRDGGKRYGGMGVLQACHNVMHEIGPAVIGMDASDQRALDFTMIELDGTANKSRLGANAILGVSLAAARATAAATDTPLYRLIDLNAHVLPVPLVNLINGGLHASNDLDFQEVCIFPTGCVSFTEAMEVSHAVNQELFAIIVDNYGKIAANTGDEGGFAPPITDVREALDRLHEAVDKAGVGDRLTYGLDCATTHLFDAKSGNYTVAGNVMTTAELMELYKTLIKDYGIVSMEDPFAEDDVDGFTQATAELGIQIVGDDFFCTNPDRIRERAPLGAGNALLWKVNQIGTLTEALTAAEIAFRHGMGVMVSERSGETEDDLIADLTVGLNCGQIKTGAPVRGERTAKYNRLLEIERELGDSAVYAGRNWRRPV